MVYLSPSSSLFAACRVLFGPEVNLSEEFLHYLQPGGVKTAFRQKVKETHPDMIFQRGSRRELHDADGFRKVAEAYELLSGYLDKRERRYYQFKKNDCRGDAADITVDREKSTDHLYHQGGVPLRRLQFGRYLYYRGVISFQTLITALAWQRKNHRLLGQLACEAGWLTSNDIAVVLSDKRPGKFGKKAVRLGLLNPMQVSTLLLRQNLGRCRIGDYFVAHAGLSRKLVARMVLEMQRHNKQF